MPSCHRRPCNNGDATMAMVRCHDVHIVESYHRHRAIACSVQRGCYNAMMLRWQWHDVTTDVRMAMLRWRRYDVTMTMARCYDGDCTLWISICCNLL